jgi:hypothetical protein
VRKCQDNPDNGHILIQVGEKGAALTPFGFAGDGLDYGMNPKFVTLPLSRIYMPHLGKPARPQIFEGIRGNWAWFRRGRFWVTDAAPKPPARDGWISL